MPQWVDLHMHGLTLLAQREPEGEAIRALVIRRLRADAQIPIEAVTYGFAQRGGEFVRMGGEFSLSAIRRLFPGSKLVDLPESAITYRRSATIVSLYPDRTTLTGDGSAIPVSDWAMIPLPRFQIEAFTAWVDGRLLVTHGEHEYQTQRRTDPAAAKAEAHRDAVTRAMGMGAELPCEVLVDYADVAYWGTKHGHAAVRAAHLLARLGVAEKLLRGESGSLVLTHPFHPALHVDRLVGQDGVQVAFTHYKRHAGGEPTLDGEVVFAVRSGRLFLAETVMVNGEGVEVRGFDTHFANAFMQALLANGYDLARISWSQESARAGQHLYGREVQSLLQLHGASLAPMLDGAYAGLFVAAGPDAEGILQLAVGVTAHAAISALCERMAGSKAGEIRHLGLNLFREAVVENAHQRRYRLTHAGPVAESENGHPRSVEFMTVAEGLEIMALGRKTGMPVIGSWLFDRPVSRVLHGCDGRQIYFSIETKGSAILAYQLVLSGVSHAWECLEEAWSGTEPTDAVLQASYARTRGERFDSDAFLEDLNAAIRDSNRGLEEAYQFPELSREQFMIVHPNATTYLLQFRDAYLPVVVAIEAEGDLWRVSTSSSKSHPVPLSSAFSAAASKLADARMHYLRRLHRTEEGGLRIGLPVGDFEALRDAVRRAASDTGMSLPWSVVNHDSPLALLPLDRLLLQETSDKAFCLRVRDADLTYEVFALELDPNATIADFAGDGARSIGQLANQMRSDIEWNESSAQRQDGTTLQAWINRYLDLQIRHYGEEHLARVPTRAVRELVIALADRNIDGLLPIFGRAENHNASADGLFEEISGLPLGENTRTRQDAVYAFCGFNAAAAERHRERLKAEEARREREEETARLTRAAERARLTLDGKAISGRGYVDRLVADGYTILQATDNGAAHRCWLYNTVSNDTILLRGSVAAYAQHVLGAAGKPCVDGASHSGSNG